MLAAAEQHHGNNDQEQDAGDDRGDLHPAGRTSQGLRGRIAVLRLVRLVGHVFSIGHFLVRRVYKTVCLLGVTLSNVGRSVYFRNAEALE